MSKYEDGVRQAKDVVRRSPGQVAYWLGRARKGRSRWRTRLFLPGKRQFLDGFVAELERYFERQPQGGTIEQVAVPADLVIASTDEMMLQAAESSTPKPAGAIPKPAKSQ